MAVSFLQSWFQSDSHSTPPPIPPRASLSICAFAFLIIVGGLSAVSQIDFPVIQFIRATPVPLLEQFGHIGNRLGHGSTLVFLSGFALCAGYLWKRQKLVHVGVQSIIAHAIAGLVTQIIKHTVGRPRPRLAHQDHWEIGPSFQSGLDAFPSGHSSASFAVATVFARQYPRYAWILYLTATSVAFSRIIKGSHFPTDACAGAFLGYVISSVFTRPLREWWTTCIDSLVKGLPFFVGATGVLWIAVQKPAMEVLYLMISGTGVLVTAIGYGVRLRALFAHGVQQHVSLRLTISSLLIAMGLSLCSGSFLITFLSALSGTAWWIAYSHQEGEDANILHRKATNQTLPAIVREGLVGIGLCILLGLVYSVRGLIPLL